jgi:hypothetical protein
VREGGGSCRALGVGDCAPRELGKRVAGDVSARHLHSEPVLLAVCGVEDVVRDGEDDEDGDEEVGVHVDRGVAVDIDGLRTVPARDRRLIHKSGVVVRGDAYTSGTPAAFHQHLGKGGRLTHRSGVDVHTQKRC